MDELQFGHCAKSVRVDVRNATAGELESEQGWSRVEGLINLNNFFWMELKFKKKINFNQKDSIPFRG